MTDLASTPLPVRMQGTLLVSFKIPEDVQGDFNRWYNREHIPARIGLGADRLGFQSCTRYVTQGVDPRYVNLYALGSADFLQSEEYLAVRAAEAEMPVVARLSGEMKRTRPDLFTRRVLTTWRRQLGGQATEPGRMVLESVRCSEALTPERLFTWAVPAYLGTATRDPDLDFSCVGVTDDRSEVLFMTGYRVGARSDWTLLEAGVAKSIVNRVDPEAEVTSDVCLVLAHFAGLPARAPEAPRPRP